MSMSYHEAGDRMAEILQLKRQGFKMSLLQLPAGLAFGLCASKAFWIGVLAAAGIWLYVFAAAEYMRKQVGRITEELAGQGLFEKVGPGHYHLTERGRIIYDDYRIRNQAGN